MNTVGKDHIQKDVGRRICCVKAVGKGSSEIAGFEAGKELTVLGPLGNGFPFSKTSSALPSTNPPLIKYII